DRLLEGRRLARAIEHVTHGKNGMLEKHSGTRKGHHAPDLLAAMRLVTMDRTVGARRLGLAVRTFLQSEPRVRLQVPADIAEFVRGRVMAPAVKRDHRRDGFSLPFEASVFECHRETNVAPTSISRGWTGGCRARSSWRSRRGGR